MRTRAHMRVRKGRRTEAIPEVVVVEALELARFIGAHEQPLAVLGEQSRAVGDLQVVAVVVASHIAGLVSPLTRERHSSD